MPIKLPNFSVKNINGYLTYGYKKDVGISTLCLSHRPALALPMCKDRQHS